MKKLMSKTKTNPTIENLDLDVESEKYIDPDFGLPTIPPDKDDDHDSLLEDDDMIDLPVATPIAPVGLAVMDFSLFEEGIEEITAESEDKIKALIYGPNGTGKNTISATFPGPILVLDINERGTKSMVGIDNIKKRSVDTFELFMMAYWYLKSGKHPFQTVVLDNVTTLQELVMKFIMKKEADFDSSKDMDMPTKRDWGGLSQVMKRWLIDFRNLPMNVVFIAQEKRTNDDDLASDEVSVFPQVSGSVKAILGAAVDVIGRTYVVEHETENGIVPRYCMRIQPNTTYLAKIRVPVGGSSPASIANPSYAALKKIMSGQYIKKS